MTETYLADFCQNANIAGLRFGRSAWEVRALWREDRQGSDLGVGLTIIERSSSSWHVVEGVADQVCVLISADLIS